MLSLKHPVFERFRAFTGLLKDFGWWLAAIFAGVGIAISFLGQNAVNYAIHFLTSILLVYTILRISSYRKRAQRFHNAMRYVHQLTHDIRDTLGEELGFLERAADERFDSVSEAEEENALVASLHKCLQKVLNSASKCFKELTGKACTAVLLMPEQDQEHGRHFLAMVYSSDACEERKETKKAHRGGLVKEAFESGQALHFADFEVELKKAKFVNSRGDEDPFRWYRSAVMTHFKVQGEKWGVLSIDSIETNIFIDDYRQLLCAFADACGIVFSIAQHGDLGNAVYEEK